MALSMFMVIGYFSSNPMNLLDKEFERAKTPEEYEEVLKKALLQNKNDIAKSCLDHLKRNFPSSLRVLKLESLIYETEDFDYTTALFKEIFKQSEADQYVLRRKVALYKSTNGYSKAIKELNEYLKIYVNDMEAFQELLDLYLDINEYKKAIFCAEELILSNPQNYLYHLQIAEIYYTIGEIKMARYYYRESNKLKPNIRSLMGLSLCKENVEKQIIEFYKKGQEEMISYLK